MLPLFAALMALSAAPCTGAIVSPDHLVPEDSILNGMEFARYQQTVVGVLHEAYDNGVQARLIEEPSFEPERAIFLRKDIKDAGEAWSIVTLRPQVHLWTYDGPLDKVQLARCQLPIDAVLAGRIKAAWTLVLLDTHYVHGGEEGVLVSDGIEYHFSAFSDDFLGGWTNSPDPKGEAGRLAGIADAMADLCQKTTPAHVAALKLQTDELLAAFPPEAKR